MTMKPEIRRNAPFFLMASATQSDGGYAGAEVVQKFGRATVGTTPVPIAFGNVWQTPQVSGATPLRIKAGGNAADTAAGAGARAITLQGLDASGNEISETIVTAGASASSATSASFLRLYRAWVSSSGTYGNQYSGSHVGDIVVEDSAGAADWATIDSNGFPKSQTEIGVYTVPAGKVAFILETNIQVATNKVVSVTRYERSNILETAAPYTAVRAKQVFSGLIEGSHSLGTPSVPRPAPDRRGIYGKCGYRNSRSVCGV